ncbi:GTPase [Paraglaciecola aquimarina]|uniref:GTPase n=1 Tax=Paraglaciecola aquimarina TaxID=1235557 RepID=A0ABU3SWM7_9ALTE|nr:GTPase [Paraglaciecola aquimarina]MDU0354415.1 GTPase [Paraglaciecola aquimarina]
MHVPEEDEQELLEEDAEEQLARLQALPIKLAIVGKPNVGKSTLTNRILGEERVVVYDQPIGLPEIVFLSLWSGMKENTS